MRVLSCVFLHLAGQWPHTPIRELVLLVCEDGAVELKQIGEADLLVANSPCRLPGIKHVDEVQAEVPLQPLNILVRSMEHLNDLWVVKDSPQRISKLLLQCNGVNDEVFLSRRNLHQASDPEKGPLTVMLQVDGYLTCPRKLDSQLFK